jgi:hypothetical protein
MDAVRCFKLLVNHDDRGGVINKYEQIDETMQLN